MNQRIGGWLATSVVAGLMLGQLAAVARAAPNSRPNVIVVLSDDQGYGDFSCHGNPVLKTPNLDRLHGQSIRLTDFHVAPMCSPTRGELLTGLDCLHNGATSVSAGRSMPRRGITLMPEIFAAGGYRTGHFGKWHLGDAYPYLPHQRGFQQTVYLTGWGVTSLPDVWNNDYFNGRFRENGVLKQYPGYCTDVWFDLAIDWMRRRQAAGEPFFLCLPTNVPHFPDWVAEKYREPYRGKGPDGFFGMIANLDENMGRLDAMLAETGLGDNTILIYFHDNGGTAGVPVFNAGMRGAKTTYYEGGHRAACFIRWPAGGLRPAADIDALTEVQDLLPTLIDLCGLAAPKEAPFDGVSLAGLLKGTTDTPGDRTLVVQYGQIPGKNEACVLWRKWRLVKGNELYDLATDPGQKANVFAAHPDVVKRMQDYYDDWWAGVAPKLSDFSPVSVGSDRENPTRLSAVDWMNVYCDNARDVRHGRNANGAWQMLVEKDGNYQFSLRRWPAEADAAMRASVPPFVPVDTAPPPKSNSGPLAEGVALPIAKARLKIEGIMDETKPVGAEDKEVTFSVRLSAGLKAPLQTWFLNDRGEQLCGAYYVYVERQ